MSELSEFDLSYVLRSLMKAQILIDFIVECTSANNHEIEEQSQEETSKPTWILQVNRASNAQDCGAGLILTNIDGMVTEYALRFYFKSFNNQAEYETLIAELKKTKYLGMKRLKAFTDS